MDTINSSRLRPGDLLQRVVLSSPDARMAESYIEYYAYQDYAMQHIRPDIPTYRYDWRERRFSGTEFVVDFMFPIVHAHMTASTALVAEDGRGGIGFGLTRTGSRAFSDREVSLITLLRPHLCNLYNVHRRSRRHSISRVGAAELAPGRGILSPREAQIAELLCLRMRPAEIATLLLRSRRTVERHIEHIYQKLGARNRREMLRALLGPASRGT